jgi:hypothetical protein
MLLWGASTNNAGAAAIKVGGSCRPGYHLQVCTGQASPRGATAKLRILPIAEASFVLLPFNQLHFSSWRGALPRRGDVYFSEKKYQDIDNTINKKIIRRPSNMAARQYQAVHLFYSPTVHDVCARKAENKYHQRIKRMNRQKATDFRRNCKNSMLYISPLFLHVLPC